MRTLSRSILAAGTVAGLLALPIAGAGATDHDTSSTTVTFSVDPAGTEALTIDQNGVNTATLSSAEFSAKSLGVGANTVTGSLPDTTVTDQRGSLLTNTWSVTVVADGDWKNQSDTSYTVPAAGARAYLPADDATALMSTLDNAGNLSLMTVDGGEFTVGVDGNNLATEYELIAGTTSGGDGSLTYKPTIDIEVPEGTPAGTYEAVVTQTLS